MKKKRMLVLSLMIIGIMVVQVTGCSEQNKTVELKLGRYVMQGTEIENDSWISLKEDKKFIFNRSLASSYLPVGTYSIEGKTLILYVEENESYIFTVDGDKLIFENSNMTADLIKKGAVFKLYDNELLK
ncbi:MAG: hypothetical protein JJT76_06660 [Clostridiaceae bacterium]|nr:hypothetical protein [Clostridiaceae bacterium]